MNLFTMTENIPRLFTERHAMLIYGLCRWLGVRNAVEVGAYHGYVTIHMAQAIKENGGGKMYVIDDYSLQDTACHIHNNMARAGLSDMLNMIHGDSMQVAWPRPIDFAFIDGNHSFDACLSDCNKAIENGAKAVAIHDTVGWWGPREYIEVFREKSGELWDVFEGNFDSGLGVLVKREPKPEPLYTQESHPTGLV